MILGTSSPLQHNSPKEWASKHAALGLKAINFPVDYTAGEKVYMEYKEAAEKYGLIIAEVGVWKNTLAKDFAERQKWINYAIEQLKMADKIEAICCVNVAGTPHGPRWDGGYKENFSKETFNQTVAMVQQIIDTAQPKFTKYSIESMPWMIPTGPDEYLELINTVNRPQFAAHLDIVNMITSPQRFFFNEDFLDECFSKLSGKIVSCHLKDVLLKPEYTFQLEECACGKGSLNLRHFIELATKQNKKMPMIIEHLTTDQEYLKSIDYIKNLAKDLIEK